MNWKIEYIKSLDRQCWKANSLWRQLEALKIQAIKNLGIKEEVLMEHQIFIKEKDED